jgi:DNA-binding NtrC family response regulator
MVSGFRATDTNLEVSMTCEALVRLPSAARSRAWRAGIVAESATMRRLLDEIERFAPHPIPVLLVGETGTGKEVLARALHDASGRSGPFVALNCATLPVTLAEAELFGVVRGAYTGADRSRMGFVEHAHLGTLFLDEVAELPPAVQAKLLRVAEDGHVQRLGTAQSLGRPVDVRLVCATNRDLAEEVRERRFRDDLYHRVAGITLRIPPLRERREDIRPLVERFLADESRSPEPRVLSRAAVTFLETAPWPGNARQLRQAIVRALVRGDTVLYPEDFADAALLPPSPSRPGTEARSREVAILLAAIESTGSLRAAARALGWSRSSANRRLKAYEAEQALAAT